jgi:hypothetical protein
VRQEKHLGNKQGHGFRKRLAAQVGVVEQCIGNIGYMKRGLAKNWCMPHQIEECRGFLNVAVYFQIPNLEPGISLKIMSKYVGTQSTMWHPP